MSVTAPGGPGLDTLIPDLRHLPLSEIGEEAGEEAGTALARAIVMYRERLKDDGYASLSSFNSGI